MAPAAAVLSGLALLAVALGAALADPVQPASATPRLPDLATLPPTHFTFAAPDGSGAGDGGRAAGAGCTAHEREQGARRCLRFTTYLTNVGEGALDLGLSADAAAGSADSAALGPLRGLVQRLHAPDGSFQERPAGVAEYHRVHDHYHVADLVSFALHAVDGDGVAASNESAAGGKTGFCLFDGFRGEPVGAGHGGARTYHRWNCRALDLPGMGMGITPGWVDRYNWTLADQYLEVSGVPDGLYRLTVVADPGGLVLETTRDNNAAEVLLHLAGNEVEVVGPPTQRPAP